MIIGVGFLLFAPINGAQKLFTVRELKNKAAYDKKAGEITFPMETQEGAEKNLTATLQRLIEEEISRNTSIVGDIKVISIFNEEFRFIPNRPDIVVFYGIGKFFGNPNQNFQPKDNDIVFSGWRTIQEMLSGKFPVRHGVIPVLNHFIGNNKMIIEQK